MLNLEVELDWFASILYKAEVFIDNQLKHDVPLDDSPQEEFENIKTLQITKRGFKIFKENNDNTVLKKRILTKW
jgi:hypothetical protein